MLTFAGGLFWRKSRCFGLGWNHLILLQGSHLSITSLNRKVEANVLAAFAALHKLNVIHGDVRRENVLVLEDHSVRLINFENGSIAAEEDKIRWEDEEIQHMLSELKGRWGASSEYD